MLSPVNALAAVIDSQPDESSDRSINNNTSWSLGQGLLKITFGTVGTGDSITIKYARNNAGTDLTTGDFPMYECTGGYATSCVQVGSFEADWTPPNDGAYYEVVLTNATPIVMDPTKYYNVVFNTSAFFVDRLKTDGSGNTYFIYESAVPPDERTRIITVTPPDDPTGASPRATSTTFAFEATGYVNADDYVDGMELYIKARNNVAAAYNAVGPSFSEGGNLICSWLPDWLCPPLPGEDPTYQISGGQVIEYYVPITSSGDFSFATTTDVQTIGRYTMFTEVRRPNVTFAGVDVSYSTFVSTTTQFTVATSSSYDRAVGAQVEAIVAQQQAVDPECYFDITSPGNWFPQIQTCIVSIFSVPVQAVGQALMGSMASLLSHAPWGYATRTFVILTGDTSTSTLPSLGTTIPAGLPMGGHALPDFAPWDGIEVAVAQLDVDDVPTMEQSPLDQFEFWWNFMWCLVFAFWLIREFYGLAEAGDFEDLSEHLGASRKMDRGIYAYRGLVQTRTKIDRANLRKTQASIVNNANARTSAIKSKYKVKGY